jgi:CRP-like cAMP-binding protein
MTNDKKSGPRPIRLKYKEGDLIIKEGDYGISIYKIIEGKVLIFNESDDREIALATLGRGEVVGEMTFLSRITERRSASVKALEDTVLEVWDPAKISKEYEQMPPIIRHIADQTLKRLIRMNRLIIKMHAKLQKK